MLHFFEEIIRRKVLPVALGYAIGAWIVLQVGDVLIGLLELPGWTGKVLVAIAAGGLPVALVLAWIYDWTPKGIIATQSASAAPEPFRFGEPEPVTLDELDLNCQRLGPLIGRHAECDTLRERLQQAKDGTGSIVLIGGEPGIGKSRLGEEALVIGREMGLLPLTGHAYEDRGAPFIVVSEILEDIIRVLPRKALRNALGNTAPEMARLLPDLRRALPNIPEAAEVHPEQQQRFLFNAVVEFLRRLSRSRPLVILFDDLHWADESSIALLEHLAPHVRRLPILMVATYRDVASDMGEPFQRALTALSREPYVSAISVRRFDRDDVRSLLTALGGGDPPANVVDAIFAETNGNAFFVQSVYQHLADEGRLFDADGAWLTDIDPASLDVPDGVRLVTGRRIARLREATQDMLNLAAVIGIRFSVRVLEAGTGGDVIESVEEAETARLIKSVAGGREPVYEFVHALARHTVLDALSPLRLQKLHLLVAEAIETTHANHLDDHAADLAMHLSEAGNYADEARTVHWLQVAGDNALAAAALDEAVHCYDTALSIVDDAEPLLRGELLRSRADARQGLGDRPGTISDLQAATSAFEAAGAISETVAVTAHLVHQLVYSGRSADALDAIARAESLVGDAPSPEKARLLSARGSAYSLSPDHADEAGECYEAAVTLARQFDDPRLLASVLQMQAIYYHPRLYGELGAEKAHEAAAMQRQLKQEWELAQCLWMEKYGLVFAGRFEDSTAIDAELNALAERQGDNMAPAIIALSTALIELSRGHLDASTAQFQRANEHFEAAGTPWAVPYHFVNLLLQGRDSEVRPIVDEFYGDKVAGTAWEGTNIGYWLSCKAWLGDDDVVAQYRKHRRYLPEPGKINTAGPLIFLKGAIEALMLAGAKADAAALQPLIEELVQRDIGRYELPFCLHECYAAIAATAAEDWGTAESHFEHALRSVDHERPHRVDQARVRYWYARMLIERGAPGDRERAGKLLARARSLSDDMGMHGLIRRIDALTVPATG